MTENTEKHNMSTLKVTKLTVATSDSNTLHILIPAMCFNTLQQLIVKLILLVLNTVKDYYNQWPECWSNTRKE